MRFEYLAGWRDEVRGKCGFLEKIFLPEMLLIFVFFMLPLAGAEDLILTRDGQALYVIYSGAEESEIVQHAAEELGQWLDRISGADFTLTTDVVTALPKIVVGRNNPLAEELSEELGFPDIENDGFRILSHGPDLFITGAIDRGTLYGVYALLDHHLGVRWFSPEFEVVPSRGTLSLPELDELSNPRFSYREVFSGDTDDAYFRQHNLLNGNRGETHREFLDYPPEIDTWSSDGPAGGHNFHDIVAEVFHSGGQIEVMNPAVRAQAADYFTWRIAEDGDAPWYGFAQEDNGWDPDEESLEFAEAHGDTLAAPIVDMLIDVTQRVRLSDPEAHLSTIAYQFSFMPPEDMEIPEYVMVEIAPIEADFGHPYADREHNRQAGEAFRGWAETATSLAVWDYQANFQNYLQPLPNIFPMCENIQFFAGMEAFRSYFGEGAYNTSGAEFAELRAWVAARLLWNPDQDYHALIEEFCDGYYGPEAGPLILQYIDLLHQSFRESGDRISSKQRITSSYLDLDFILEAGNLLAEADTLARGPYAGHVHEVRMGVDMTILLREHLYAAEAARRGILWVHDPDRRSRFQLDAEAAGVEEYAEDGTIDRLFTAIDIERVAPPEPAGLALEGKEWIDFQDLDFSYCCGARMVEDTRASDHGAVALDNGEWAITLPLDVLPPGKEWILYAAVRVELLAGADAETVAFNMGRYPGSWISPTVGEIEDENYHLYRFPEMPVVYQTGSDVWFSADDGISMLFVDRIIAVAKSGGPERINHGLYMD